MQFLPELPEDITLQKINELFSSYLDTVYHQRIHGSTGQKPMDRYLADVKALRKAPENLPEYFRKQEVRTVSADRTVQLNSRLYEAPAGLAGMKVVLRYEEPDRIEVFVDDSSKGFLKDLNQEVNSRVKRDNKSTDTPALPPVTGGKLFGQNTGGV
jgi:putative transposase